MAKGVLLPLELSLRILFVRELRIRCHAKEDNAPFRSSKPGIARRSSSQGRRIKK
jgi:hypothetical protein